jgi:hypothetical protein
VQSDAALNFVRSYGETPPTTMMWSCLPNDLFMYIILRRASIIFYRSSESKCCIAWK